MLHFLRQFVPFEPILKKMEYWTDFPKFDPIFYLMFSDFIKFKKPTSLENFPISITLIKFDQFFEVDKNDWISKNWRKKHWIFIIDIIKKLASTADICGIILKIDKFFQTSNNDKFYQYFVIDKFYQLFKMNFCN